MIQTPDGPAPVVLRNIAILGDRDVPEPVVDHLCRAVAETGLVVQRITDPDRSPPSDSAIGIILFAEIDPGLRRRLGAVAATPLLGVALRSGLSGGNDASVAEAWSQAGHAIDTLLRWDGVSPPVAVIDRILDLAVPPMPRRAPHPAPMLLPQARPSHADAGVPPMIEIVLRNGRLIRVPTGIAPELLKRLIATLDG